MSWLDAVVLGLVQGVTEFFPISSSAHISLARLFFGIETSEKLVLFDLSCHLGTLVAVFYFLRRDIADLFRSDRKKLGLLCVALLPLVPCYFLLKPLRDFMAQPQYLGFCLMITSAILFLGYKYRLRRAECGSLKRQVSDALWIGALQSTALIPGISRSASTISCARILGWDGSKAVRFSFLLSIPTIVGGNCLELIKLSVLSPINTTLPLSLCTIGFISSCAAGLLIVNRAMSLLESGNLKPFAWYCLTLGVIAVCWLTQ